MNQGFLETRKGDYVGRTVTGLCLLVCLLGSMRSSLADSPRQLTGQGNQLFKQERFQEAIDVYRQALEKEPSSPLIQYNLGTALAFSGDHGEAQQVLGQAADTPATVVQRDSYYNLGVSLADSAGPPAGGASQSAQPGAGPGANSFPGQLRPNLPALPGSPQPGSSFPMQADPQMQLMQLNQALDAFRKVILLDPSDDEARFNYEVTLDRIEALRQQQDQQQQNQQQSQNEEDKDEKSEDQQEKQSPDQPDRQDKSDPNQQQNQQQDQEDSDEGQQEQQEQQEPDEGQAGQQQQGEEQPPTPEQMDAMRLLNLLEAENPEQFKRLLQYRMQLRRPPEKDW